MDPQTPFVVNHMAACEVARSLLKWPHATSFAFVSSLHATHQPHQSFHFCILSLSHTHSLSPPSLSLSHTHLDVASAERFIEPWK